jgi:hypothetical protein
MRSPIPLSVFAMLAIAAASPAAEPPDAPPGGETTSAGSHVHVGARGDIHVRIPRAVRPPVLDGTVDPEEWRVAARLDSFTHYEPVEGMRDTAGTVCLVMYDTRHLYVAFLAQDDPTRVQAPVVARDEIHQGDWVGLSLDTYRDLQRSMFLASNARGIQMDGVDTESGESDLAPDFLYASKGRRTAQGFEVEMAIPFTTLRFRAADSLTMGFNPIRDIKRNGVHMFFSPITRQKQGYHGQIGTLQGMTGVRPGRNLKVNPTLTGTHEGVRGGGGFVYEDEARAGLNLKYGVTSNLIADVAITPDFSQVESDAAVVNINERFAIFFEEKRPFFLESRDLFTTPVDLVYTRRIVDPLYGGKLTGKVAHTGVGVLQAMDRSAGEPIPTLPDLANPYLGEDARFDIVRLRQDVLKGSHVGVLFADRQHSDAWNRVAGLDTRLALGEHYEIQAQGVLSGTRDPDLRAAIGDLDSSAAAGLDPKLLGLTGDRHDGSAVTLSAERSTRASSVELRFEDVSKHFDAQMGFVPRTDFIAYSVEQSQHRYSTGKAWWQKFDWWTEYERTDAHGDTRHFGARLDEELSVGSELWLPDNVWFGAFYARVYTLYEGAPFPDQDRFSLWLGSERWRTLRFGLETDFGENVVFEEGVPGRFVSGEAWVDWRVTDQVDGRLTLNGSVVERRADHTRFADALIPRSRLTVQFTPALSLRWIAQLEAERRYDPAGARTSREIRATNDLLATYYVRPGTAVYAGYGTLGEGDAVETVREARNQVFVKLSYLFQM